MRAENGTSAVGHFVQFLDENGAEFAEFLNYVFVVNDFLADVDRATVEIQGDFDDIDSPDHAGAEPTRLEKVNLLVSAGIGGNWLNGHRKKLGQDAEVES